MIEPVSKTVIVLPGTTPQIALKKDARFTRTSVAVKEGISGVLSFRAKVLFGQYETPEAPNTLDISVRKSISFIGESVEELEVANPGAAAIKLVITQSAA